MKDEMSRREFLKEGGKAGLTVAAGLVFGDLVAETSLSAEAAEFSDFTENNLDETNGISYEQAYQTFVNDFATGEFVTDRNPYIKIDMGKVEQFVVRDTTNNKAFILDYYKDCIKNKKHGSLSNFYSDSTQANFLKQCEDYLYHLSVYPNDTAVAIDFLNYVKSNMLIKDKHTSEGDFSTFDPYYIKDVPVYETVCEMVQAAWEKISVIESLRQNIKPEDMGDTEGYWCAQVIIDMLCGRSDRSYIDPQHLRHSGITKGNKQLDLLIKLNLKYPNSDIKYMIMASLIDLRSKEDMCSLLNMSSAEYDAIARSIRNSRQNGLDDENGHDISVTTKYGVFSVPYGSTIADVMKMFSTDIRKQIVEVKIKNNIVSFDTMLLDNVMVDFIEDNRLSEDTPENIVKFYNTLAIVEAGRVDGVIYQEKDNGKSLSLTRIA